MHQLPREPQSTHRALVASPAQCCREPKHLLGWPSTFQGGRINFQKGHEVSKGLLRNLPKEGKGEVTMQVGRCQGFYAGENLTATPRYMHEHH